MATDDQGGNPTELSGVTFIGAPSNGQTFSIRRSTGKVLGPFEKDLIVQMIRGSKLTGDEGVSPDRQTWTPILSVPEFAAAFAASDSAESGSTQLGLKTVGETMPSAGPMRIDSMGVPPVDRRVGRGSTARRREHRLWRTFRKLEHHRAASDRRERRGVPARRARRALERRRGPPYFGRPARCTKLPRHLDFGASDA